MAGRCQGKPLAWFLSHLPREDQVNLTELATQAVQAGLDAAVRDEVSLSEVSDGINSALASTRAIDADATVIQVSTGAGKTRAVVNYLNNYSAPFEDESERSGRTSVMAVPTNALLAEVQQRIRIPHTKRVGALAVLNDDGTPACKKYDIAKDLQTRGGNIHRLLCAHCEFKEDCAARTGTSTGLGAMTITNHSLLPSVTNTLLAAGRHPLIVWDESPKWVQQSVINLRDLQWILSEFREADERRKDPIRALVEVGLFTEAYHEAINPVLRLLEHLLSPTYACQQYSVAAAADRLFSYRANRTMLDIALRATKLAPSGSSWNDMRNAFSKAYRLNTVEMGFDAMRNDTRQRVLRMETLVDNISKMLGDDAIVIKSETHLSVASLTADATLFRSAGGVILDATANMSELRSLRPDLRSVELRVEDAGVSDRYLVYTEGLSRKQILLNLGAAVDHAKRAVRRWAKAQDDMDSPKVAVFTYKSAVSMVRALWPEAEVGYFGNVRGYDHFFQDGYDAFITLGDPIPNLDAMRLQWTVLNGDMVDRGGYENYVAAAAAAECAQAHGRARSPQAKLGTGDRLHMHFGKLPPTGWDSKNTQIESLAMGVALSDP